MPSRYAVLGGGGSFGIHTSKYLLEQDDIERVIAVGRNAAKPEPFTLNVGDGDPRYSYHAYHITHELDLLLELLDREQPQVIVNYAAQGEGAVSWKHSWRFFETNSTALARLSEELMKRDYLERFIQIGTSELYGSVEHAAKESDPLQPTSPYAASKAAFDMYLQSVHRVLGFPMNIIRPSNAYCPGQLLHRVVPRAVISGLTGQKLPLHGGGRAEKSYIHARDLARAILLVADDAPLGTTYNAGPAAADLDPLPHRARRRGARDALRGARRGDARPPGPGQPLLAGLKRHQGRRRLEPEIDLPEGLRDMVQWGRRYVGQLDGWPMDYTLRA